ncbi:MAG: FAD/NAD(P)-binding protein [Phycisphaerae bacterium]|jgi:NAD(P)H-flavin reductase
MADVSKVKDLYLPRPASVVSREMMTSTETLFDVRLDSGQELDHWPGQFVEVTVPGFGEAPISVSSSPDRKGGFHLVVRKTGRVTAAMHDCPEGTTLGIRGPFGTHFPVDGAMRGRDVVFIAGGIGLAPLRSAIQYVLEHRKDYGRVSILYGTRMPSERLFVDELTHWTRRDDVELLETVDRSDGQWKGTVGVITTLIPKVKIDPAKTLVVACGPPVMYKFVILSLYDVGLSDESIYVSLERRMKCGVGKCGHCQINGLYACTDGPVFKYADILHVQEAI